MTTASQSVSSDDRVMEDYYAEVRQCALLEAAEEMATFKRYRTCPKCRHRFKPSKKPAHTCPKCESPRDLKARDALIKGALRFVVKMAKEYARRTKGISYAPDYLNALISAGNLGLMIAVDRFDSARGTRFLTYAAWWIREKILEELDGMGVVRVPAYRQKQLRARRKQGETGEGDEANVHMEEISVADAHKSDDTLELDLMNEYGASVIHDALEALGLRAREKYIVLAYFGAKEDPKNLRQISNRLGLSSERVRQIKKDTLLRLKVFLEAQEINDSDDVFTE